MPVLVIKKARKMWIEKWIEPICTTMNGHRNFVVNQMYLRVAQVCAARNDGNGDPEYVSVILEYLFKIVQRDVKPPPAPASPEAIAQHRDLVGFFVIYWDKLLPPVAGESTWWREVIRHNQCLSTAKARGLECVPASSEALCYLIVENNEARWKKIFAKNNCGRNKNWKVPKSNANVETKEYASKYSSSNVGAPKYGGWSNDGRRRYNVIKGMVEAGRNQEHVPALEMEVLKKVRFVHNLTVDGADPAACEPGRKRKRNKDWDDLEDCE